MDYQINGNCSITAAVRNASHLIELGFSFLWFLCLFLAAAICLPGTSSINKLFRLRWGFIPATVSHLLSLLLSLSLPFPFSHFLAHSNDCHGNHQRCQTTDKRKSFNIHLSQKEQNCILIAMGTIKTVHIYWQGTSHRSICSWIPKKNGMKRRQDGVGWWGRGTGVFIWWWYYMFKWLKCPQAKYLSVISFAAITHSHRIFYFNTFLKEIWSLPTLQFLKKYLKCLTSSNINSHFLPLPLFLLLFSTSPVDSYSLPFNVPRTRKSNLSFAQYSEHTRLSSSKTSLL